MKYKKILLCICIIACVLFSISSVMASDVNETVIANEDEQQAIQQTNDEIIDSNNKEEILSANNNLEEQISQTDNNILTYSVQVSSYSDLVNKIEQAKNTNYNEYIINLENREYVATKDMIEWWAPGENSRTKTLIINGNGATLNGINKYSFIKVGQDYTLALNNIKIINFAKYESYGSVDKLYGGAIFVDTLGTLTIANCEFENNHAKRDGGAIFSDGILVIRKSIFSKNTADRDGGAISTDNAGKCDIQTSLFESNKARTGGAIDNGANGALISNNIFTKNEAEKGGGAIDNGGWIETPYSTVIYDQWGNRIEGERTYYGLNTHIIKNTFVYNKAEYGSAINNRVKSILIDSNNFYSNSATSSASQVIVNTADNVEISNNVMSGTYYYSTISNSDSYSKISNNVFDDAPNTIFSIPGAGTYKTAGSSKTVKKLTPKLTAKKATFKVKTKTKKYTVILKTNKNKAMKKVKLYLKVNGKTYTAKTNSKGKATFKITKLKKKGTFKATITFKGNKNYKKVTKTIKIKCK